MRRVARVCAILLLWAGWSLPAAAANSAPSGAGWSHELDVTIDPGRNGIEAADKIVVGSDGGPLLFSLHAGLKITTFTIDGKDARGTLARVEGGGENQARHLISYRGPELLAGARLRLVYRGKIYDPVSPAGGPGFDAGDATTGIIGSEGVFLDGRTGWIPIIRTRGDDLATYDVTSRVPDPWRVVTQGRRQPSKPSKGFSVARYQAELPSDGLALVAGRYTVKSIEHDGMTISTYFFEDEAPLANLFLSRTAECLDRFSTLLVPYPYSRLDIVENFFTTGYGFPSFTLLGHDLVKMGEAALRPGYVDHEIAHCWWGNYVYPDAATGNWSEGLTTYLAGYMAQEAAGAMEAAGYRRNIAQKYSLRVKPELDYPLARFTERKRDFENEIGFGKAAMVFHMLRRMSGDDAFFRALRAMTVRFGGRRAGWADFRAAFEEATGRDLGGFFGEWIGRAGLPALALGETRSERFEGTFRVTGSLEQGGGPPETLYHLTVPVVLETARGRREYAVELKDHATTFSLEADALPLEIRLDPDMHVPRWVPATDDEARTPERHPLVQDITSGSGGIAGTALMDHARALASVSMEGRRPGTPGHDAAASYIERFFADHGVAPAGGIAPFIDGYRHSFALPLVDVDPTALGAAQIRVSRAEGDTSYPARPFPIAPDVAANDAAGSRDDAVFLEPEDLASFSGTTAPPRLEGGTVLTVERPFPREEDAPTDPAQPEIDPRAAALLADEVRGAARLGASILIVLRGSDGPSVYEPLLSFPSHPSLSDAGALDAGRKAGEFPGADIFFSGRAGRLPFPGPPPALLVLSAGPELGADLLGRHPFARLASTPLVASEPGYRPILLDVEITASAPLRVDRRPMVNIVGYLEGRDASLKAEAVVLTAHYDAIGRSEDGAMLAGASDNAAGVAALLETARWLSDPARRPARSVVLAATDGEEWGLAGSRALAGRLSEMSLRPVALVNVDSIGSSGVAEPWLIGGSHRPEIRSVVEALAAVQGLALGRDIDRDAFDYGSDYYPFHLAGVPAVGFFAANRRSLHRSTDNLESLDAAALERVSRLVALTVWALAM